MLRKLSFLTLLVLTLISVSCVRPYKIPIQQGNVVTTAMIKRLKVGMNQTMVTAILGDPILENIYKNNLAIYIYTFKPSHGPTFKHRLIIYFRNGRLMKYMTDYGVGKIDLPKPYM